MYDTPLLFWIFFNLFVLVMLALDLGVFHRKAHEVKVKEALIWCGVWMSLALVFNAVVYFWRGPTPALEFLTGYLIEWSLSVDNIFVFVIIFSYFGVPAVHQHRVLFWGILGALVMRALFIAAGVTLIQRFHGIIYVFGAFLVFTAIKMWFTKGQELHPEKNLALILFRRLMPVSDRMEGGRFFVMKEGKRFATPLFVVLLLLETTDLIFAVDSIPAILAITQDPFLVYTSNIFAILGLRSLYFALAGVVAKFEYLHYGLAVILGFVGLKMLLADVYKVPVTVSLGIIVGTLVVSVLLSLRKLRAQEAAALSARQ